MALHDQHRSNLKREWGGDPLFGMSA